MKSKLLRLSTLALVFFVQFSFAQIKSVSGIVSDANGPLPGATVMVKGTSNGTQTDFDGNYSISAKSGETLVFSYIGMVSQEVLVDAEKINITLQQDVQELEAVVVTALGIKRDKKAIGYATTTVTNEQITNVVNNNPLESLSGKIAGVDISAPAQPGSSTKVVIRGYTSITGSNAPLYVVDGTPINNSELGSTNSETGSGSVDRSYDAGTGINDLDPNNIESMTILKGSAAAALYGSRAANGAIIITTKKGKRNNKIKVDFQSTFDVSEVARVPHLQTQFGQGWSGEGYSNTANGLGPSNENGSWGPAFTGEILPWGTVYNNSQQIKPYVALEDNMRDFYKKGLSTTNFINISGGNELSDFSISFTNLDSDGVIPTTADKLVKRTLGFNGGINGDKLSVRSSINYSNKNQNAVNTGQGDDAGQGSTLIQDLLQIPVDVSIVDLEDYTNNPFNSPSYYFTPYATNPYWSINENSTRINGHNLYGNLNFNYKITPKLNASWQVGGSVKTDNVKSHGAVVKYADGSPQALASANEIVGGVTEEKTERTEFDTYFNLNYNTNITEDLDLNVLVGTNYNQRETNSLVATITNLDIPNYYELNNSAVRPTLTQNNTLRRTLGVYSQAELGYKGKYYLTFSARNDITSTLPLDNNSYFYPAASLSTILIQNNTSFLKVRGAIAQVASDTNPYQTESSLIQGVSDAYFGTISAPVGGVNYYELGPILGNPLLKPERTTEIEFGIEGNFYSNRITYDISLYKRKTNDLIIELPLDPSTGFSRVAGNFADVENKGIELATSFTPIQTKNFKWSVNYTFTKNLNEVTRVEEGFDQIPIKDASAYSINFYAVKGEPIGTFYGPKRKTNADGQYIVNADTGFYEVTENQKLGNAQRDFVMGLQNMFKYKNVSLNFAFDWKQGGEMYSYTKRLSHFTGNGIETTYNDRNTFIIPNSVNENTDGTYSENTTPVAFGQVTNFYAPNQNPGSEQTHIIDKTFIRLRDLNITYSLPSNIVNKLGASSMSIGMYGKNLFLWTPGDNPYVDPETTSYGSGLLSEFGEFGSNPSQRSFGGFLKLSF